MEMAKEAMKEQFDKKRQNPQKLKEGNNMWLEVKKNTFKSILKKFGPEKIQTLQNFKEYYLRSISARTTRRMGNL